MTEPIASAHAVHLCLDMQRLFEPGRPWATPWMERVTPNVVRLAEAFGARNVFTRFIPPLHPGDAPGRWARLYAKWPQVCRNQLPAVELDLIADLARFVPPCPVFDKAAYSAFHDGRLHAFLRDKDVRTLVLSGAETDICVLASAMAAVDHGYRVILVQDAVCSSSDAGHDALMSMYRTRLAVQIGLLTAAEVAEMLER